jgi:S1-C subfamily serine protease
MERIVLRHLSGSKANQVEEFPLNHFKELTIGRDPSNAVKYDPDRDDLVGRQHAKITQDPADPTSFTVTDLNSRNGTYLNKQRIVGSAKVVPGDVVQMGPGGPEFQFDLEPRPANFIRTTRIATDASAGSAIPATRVGDVPGPLVGPPPTGSAAPPIGRATVERMVAQSKSDSRKFVALGIIAVIFLVLVGGVVAFILYRAHQADLAKQNQGELGGIAGKLAKVEEKTSAMSAADIMQKDRGSVVWIEASWKLIFTGTGGQVYHRYYPLKGRKYPLYYQSNDGRYLPILSLDSGNGLNESIGQSGFGGSGFAITNDGFILTNRHVAANWFAPMSLPPGLVVALDQNGAIATDEEGNVKFLGTLDQGVSGWIPAEAVRNRSLMGKALEGRNDYLDVTFADNKLRIPAQLARVSDEHDVAMIKINIPEPVPSLQLFDNYDSIREGDSITVIGYPLATQLAPVAVKVKGQAGGLGPGDRIAFVPQPTVTTGVVARVIKSGNNPDYYTTGDEYQHTAATNPGNSGGPVFDQFGRVIAVHFAGFSGGVQGANFAVPIKYGMDLMGTRTVSR